MLRFGKFPNLENVYYIIKKLNVPNILKLHNLWKKLNIQNVQKTQICLKKSRNFRCENCTHSYRKFFFILQIIWSKCPEFWWCKKRFTVKLKYSSAKRKSLEIYNNHRKAWSISYRNKIGPESETRPESAHMKNLKH